jgi:hypothetical protein
MCRNCDEKPRRPAGEPQRAEFIRERVKRAIRKREYAAIREAYLRQPDSPADADDWSNAEEFLAEPQPPVKSSAA